MCLDQLKYRQIYRSPLEVNFNSNKWLYLSLHSQFLQTIKVTILCYPPMQDLLPITKKYILTN